MDKEFKKVPLEDANMVYQLYCREENVEFDTEKCQLAVNIYEKLLQNGNYTYACYVDDKIVAVVNVYKNMQYYPTDLDAPYVHLECVIVDKPYQNRGIGTELITNVISLVKAEGFTYIIAQSAVVAMQKVLYKSGLIDTSHKDFRGTRFNL